MSFNPNNHTDSFQPSHGTEQLGDAKQVFAAGAGLLLWVISILSVFWAMVVKRPGTVGTRAYFVDMLLGVTLLTALSQNSWYPDRYLFQGSTALLFLLYVWHLLATLFGKKHVHTRCIGSSRFGSGHTGSSWELLLGILAGCGFGLLDALPYGLFLAASSLALTIKEGLVEERDRQRSVQMQDAMIEQQFAMEHYEQYQRERGRR